MAADTQPSRNWPKRLFIALIAMAVLCALLLLAARLLMRTSWGHGFIERKIEAVAPAGQSVEITGVTGDLFRNFKIEALTISDSRGVWMSAKGIDTTWSPWPLLRKHVVIDAVAISDIQLMRRPVIVPSNEPPPITFRSYALGALDIPRLSIAKALTGHDVLLRADGSVRQGKKGGQLQLNSQTLNAPVEDSAVIDLEWSPEFLLKGDAKIVGEAGGLVAKLLNFGTQDTLYLDIKTNGTQENLTTRLEGRLDKRSFIRGEIRKIGNKAEITAKLSPKIIPKYKNFEDILGGDVTLSATLSELSKDTEITARLAAPKLNMDLTAANSAKGFIFPKLNLTARTPLSSFPDAPISVETMRLTGSGALEDTISFSGDVQASSLKYDNFAAKTISGPIDLTFKDTDLNFETQLTGVIADSANFGISPQGNPRLLAKGRYDFQAKHLDLKAANIQLPGLRLSAKGIASLKDSTADMSGIFDIEKGILNGKLPASLEGKFTTTSLGGKIEFDIFGNAKDFVSIPAPLSSLIGETASFDAKMLVEAGRGISLSAVAVKGDDIALKGSGDYDFDSTLMGDIGYEVGAIDISNTRLTSVVGRAKLSGKAGALNFDVAGKIPEITASQQTLTNVAFSVQGQQSGQAVTADIVANGNSEDGPISITSMASYEQSLWQALDTDIALSGLAIKGNMSGAGSNLASVSGDFSVSGDPSNYLPAKIISLDVSFLDSVVDVNGKIAQLNTGPLTDAVLQIDAKGPRNSVRFNIGIDGETEFADINRKLSLDATGRGDLSLPRVSIEADLAGTLGQNEISTLTPLRITQTESGLRGGGALSLFGGNMSFALPEQTRSITLKGENFKLADIMPLMGRSGLEGGAGFEADLRKSTNGFDADLTGRLRGVRQPGSDAEALEATLSGQLIDGDLQIRVNSSSGALSGETTLGGSVVTLSAPPFVKWPPQSPLRGEAAANGSITSLMDIFMPPETFVAGNMSLDMRYSLPLEVDGMNGSLSLSGGSFEQGDIGLTLNDINFASLFKGKTVSVTQFTATDSKSGTLTGRGEMDIGFTNGSTINLTANKLRVFDRREGFAVMSGELKLNHDGDKLALRGELIADDAGVSIANFPRAGRPTLDVNFSVNEIEEDEPARTSTALDVKISSPSRIKLTGRGVNASMSLDAHVTGAFNDPHLSGEAEITRGRFNFLGKPFALGDSKVIFNDDIMESRLAVAAVRETADLTATIKVAGTISRPEIELTSTPQLPEDEVLSRILFGRSASQLTTLETARLAAALAQLSGGGGFDLMGGLENALGLDTLDFGQSDSGATQLTTGKYLSDDVYVEVRSSAEGTPGLAVEWTPRKNVSIEAETAPGETQRVSVQWQKDFD